MRIPSLSLMALLGVGSIVCTFSEAIAPTIARAYTSRVNITLDRQPNESFATLVRRGEAVARAAAQRSFDNDILVTEASIIITGQNIGLSAPILTLDVNRPNWTRHPDTQRWSKYYPNSKQLLRIDDPVPAVATAPSPQAGQRPEPTLGTGLIQTTLRWSTTDDLDLEVIDPSNQRVFFGNKRVASGGALDVDSNAGCQDTITNPVENIFWPQTGAPPGNYVVRVNLYQRCGTQSGPISFKLRLLVQGRTQEITGTVDSSTQLASFPFIFTAGNPPPPGTPIVPAAGTGNQPSNPATTPGQRPPNRTGGGTPRANPTPNTRPSSPNRTSGATPRRTPTASTGRTPANRTSVATPRRTPTASTGRTPANRTSGATPRRTPTASTGRTPANRTSGATPRRTPTASTGRTPANRTSGATPRRTPTASTGRTPANRTSGATPRRTPTASTGRTPANRTSGATPRRTPTASTGRTPANRTSGVGQRASSTNRRSGTAPASNTNTNTGRSTNNGSTNRPTNTPTPVQNRPPVTQPTRNNRPAPTYGPGVIRRARELQQRLNTNPPNGNLPEN